MILARLFTYFVLAFTLACNSSSGDTTNDQETDYVDPKGRESGTRGGRQPFNAPQVEPRTYTKKELKALDSALDVLSHINSVVVTFGAYLKTIDEEQDPLARRVVAPMFVVQLALMRTGFKMRNEKEGLKITQQNKEKAWELVGRYFEKYESQYQNSTHANEILPLCKAVQNLLLGEIEGKKTVSKKLSKIYEEHTNRGSDDSSEGDKPSPKIPEFIEDPAFKKLHYESPDFEKNPREFDDFYRNLSQKSLPNTVDQPTIEDFQLMVDDLQARN